MAQATLTGPIEHPLADADRIVNVESDPVTWIHDTSDRRACTQCGEEMQLADGDYIVVTLRTDRGDYREKTLVHFCSGACYGNWASVPRESGWE